MMMFDEMPSIVCACAGACAGAGACAQECAIISNKQKVVVNNTYNKHIHTHSSYSFPEHTMPEKHAHTPCESTVYSALSIPYSCLSMPSTSLNLSSNLTPPLPFLPPLPTLQTLPMLPMLPMLPTRRTQHDNLYDSSTIVNSDRTRVVYDKVKGRDDEVKPEVKPEVRPEEGERGRG